MSNSELKLPRVAAPEVLGFDSTKIITALDEIEKNNINLHSVMLIRHGKVAFECHRFPYKADTVHCMYSISKNVTAVALGFAVAEGLVSLDDKLVDFFPEYLEKHGNDEDLKAITVRHLVTMTAGRSPSDFLDKTKTDWGRDLADAKKTAKPGEKFEYVNECYFNLSKILRKVTGQSLVNYLKPRLWEPLGIDTPYWETDNNGIEAGAWGLRLSIEDFAKLFLCIKQFGQFDGKQIIPRDWLEAAILNQKDPANPTREKGYGYSFWRKGEDNYRGIGFFGQVASVYENENTDALLVVTAGDADSNRIIHIFHRTVMENMITEKPRTKTNIAFTKNITSRALDVVEKSIIRSPIEKSIKGKTIKFEKNKLVNKLGYPMSVLSLSTTYLAKDKGGNIDNVEFDFADELVTFKWTENGIPIEINCGMNGEYIYNEKVIIAKCPYTVAASAKWIDNYTLSVIIRPIESIIKRELRFEFFGNGKVEMTPFSTPTVIELSASVLGDVQEAFSTNFGKAAIKKGLDLLAGVLEPVHHGKII